MSAADAYKTKKDKVILPDMMGDMSMQKKSKIKQKMKEPAHTRAARAGLVFPVSRIHTKLKNLVPTHARVGGTAAVYMAAVLEYLVAELCELAGNRAKSDSTRNKSLVNQNAEKRKRVRITPRAIRYAIHNDTEFRVLLHQAILSGSGVIATSDAKLKEQMSANKSAKQVAASKQTFDMGNDADDDDANDQDAVMGDEAPPEEDDGDEYQAQEGHQSDSE